MADENALLPTTGIAQYLHVHLGDQRAGRVEDPQATTLGFLLHGTGDAVRRKDDDHVVGHLMQFLDEDRAAFAQAVDHETVVYHFMAHVDRRAEHVQRPVDDLDGTIDTGAETAGIGQLDLHGCLARCLPSGW